MCNNLLESSECIQHFHLIIQSDYKTQTHNTSLSHPFPSRSIHFQIPESPSSTQIQLIEIVDDILKSFYPLSINSNRASLFNIHIISSIQYDLLGIQIVFHSVTLQSISSDLHSHYSIRNQDRSILMIHNTS